MSIVSSAATCDVLEVENASWEVLGKNSVLINGNTVIAGTLINYTCDFGFQMIHNEEGPATPLNCMDNGEFDKDPPSCRGINNSLHYSVTSYNYNIIMLMHISSCSSSKLYEFP